MSTAGKKGGTPSVPPSSPAATASKKAPKPRAASSCLPLLLAAVFSLLATVVIVGVPDDDTAVKWLNAARSTVDSIPYVEELRSMAGLLDAVKTVQGASLPRVRV
jgi:hypothetical protein